MSTKKPSNLVSLKYDNWLYFGGDYMGTLVVFWFNSRQTLLKKAGVKELRYLKGDLKKRDEVVKPLFDDPTLPLKPEVLEELNFLLGDASGADQISIAWWGSLLDLANGRGDFETRFRRGFREGEREDSMDETDDEYGEDDGSPISSEEMPRFRTYTRSYLNC
jgi:hypothetical protein